jgi:putative glycosyltransferase (TIGR04348 family)
VQRQLGHEVLLEQTWDGEESDVMLSLHARHSYPSVKATPRLTPNTPLILALTGTDLYRDIRSDEAAIESVELATALIPLQEKGVEKLEPRHRRKARVIYQSAEPVRRLPPAKRRFDVCVLGNLRAEKDPFRTVLATRLLPPPRAFALIHVGKPYSEGCAEEARVHAAESPRYHWIGKVPRWKARRLLARSRLPMQTSIMEGGANAISEALAARVAVPTSYIRGNVGIVGEDYPGYYLVGDEKALARVLYRGETDDTFYETLEAQCHEHRYLVLPKREKAALGSLVEEVRSRTVG